VSDPQHPTRASLPTEQAPVPSGVADALTLNFREARKDLIDAFADPGHPYHESACALLGAYEQMALGKGRERHANDLPFVNQRMLSISRQLDDDGGMAYQVCKKTQESRAMKPEKAVHELRGAIVYTLGMILFRAERSAELIAPGVFSDSNRKGGHRD